MSGLQYIERYMAKIERKSGKILIYPENSNFRTKIRIFWPTIGQKIRIFKNPRVIYPEILQGISGPNFSSKGLP